MITATEILPCPALQPYIRCYTLREFNKLSTYVSKPVPANHEFRITFNLKGSCYYQDTVYKDLRPASKQHIFGLQTGSTGKVVLDGDIKFFSISFKPNGFYQLFGIPSHLVTNNALELSDIIKKGLDTYNDQLEPELNLSEMKILTDKFLMMHLLQSKATDPHHSITSTSLLIYKSYGNVNIKSLAYEANMSLKRFETRFTEQVGIPPKIFARLTRFNYALFIKMQNIDKSWTDISHQCGYYDQMHFIKEFKEFAGDSPGNFYKKTPPPYEEYRHQ